MFPLSTYDTIDDVAVAVRSTDDEPPLEKICTSLKRAVSLKKLEDPEGQSFFQYSCPMHDKNIALQQIVSPSPYCCL